MAQRVHECATPVAAGGMDYHVERLVNDGQMLILIEDLQRNLLRDRRFMRRFGKLEKNLVVVAHLVAGLGDAAVDSDRAGVDALANERPAKVRELGGKKLIQARTLDFDAGN